MTQPEVLDSKLCDEVVSLVDGTHWVQEALHTWCPVPINGKVEDVPLEDLIRSYRVTDGYDNTTTIVNVPSGSSLDDYGYGGTFWKVEEIKPQQKKAQWCLVGMVLKVAGLRQSEGAFQESKQASRIIDEINKTLRDQGQVIEMTQPTHTQRVGTIEDWNDVEGRTKEEVRDVVADTRDRLLAEGR